MFKIDWGVKARDKITGFEGIVTARCEHLTGCNTIGLTFLGKDGKPETEWFDETKLEVVDHVPLMNRPWALDAVVPSGPALPVQATAGQAGVGELVELGGPQDRPRASNPNP